MTLDYKLHGFNVVCKIAICFFAVTTLVLEIMVMSYTLCKINRPYLRKSRPLFGTKAVYRSAYSGHWHLHHSRVVAGTPPGDALEQHGADRDERRCAVLG